MAAITTGAHPKALWPGVQAFWGTEYERNPDYLPRMFSMGSSNKAYEEDVETTSFGLVPVKPEGSGTQYDEHQQQTVTRYTHVTYSLGAVVTMEEIADNLYRDRAFQRAALLAFSMYTTRQIVGANIFNRGFNSSYPLGDGKEFFATDHPVVAGTQSNELATAADLSEAALEDLLIQIRNAKNSRGLKINLIGQMLMVPPDLEFEATRIVKSTLRSGTANNDVNAMREMGMLPDGIVCNPYLTDADAFFIRTNAPNGAKWMDRMAPALTRDNDFDTSNAKMKTTARFVAGASDWRSYYASPGA